MHDLEKGRPAGSFNSNTGFAFPQRRRKLIIVVLFLSALGLFLFASEQSNTSYSPSSWKWVKDSMRPMSSHKQGAASSSVVDTLYDIKDLEGSSPTAQYDLPFEPTPALVSFASVMKTPLPTSRPHDLSETDGPAHIDQVLLFLAAMKDKAYQVPELQVHRAKELQPTTTADFVKTLIKIKADTDDQFLVSDAVK